MKLPGWKPSVSTDMPRIGAPQLGAPAMVRPAVQRFVPLDDPNDYMRLGAAEAGKYKAYGDLALNVADVTGKIIDANTDARANTIIAAYAKDRGQFTFDNTDGSPFAAESEEDAPGGAVTKAGPWEDAQERYETSSAELQEKLLEDAGFLTAKARAKIVAGFAKADSSNTDKIRTYVNDQRVSQGRAAVYYEAENALDEDSINNAFLNGAQSRLFDKEEAQKEAFKYVREFRFKKSLQIIDAIELTASEMTLEQFDDVADGLEVMFFSNEWGLKPEDAIKATKRLDGLRDEIEDRNEIIADGRATQFLQQWLNPNADQEALRDLYFDKPRAYWGSRSDFLAGIVKEAQEKGAGDVIGTSQLREDITMWKLGSTDFTATDLQARITKLAPSLDASQKNGILSDFARAHESRKSAALDSINQKIAGKMGFPKISDMSSYAREHRDTDPAAAEYAQIAVEVLDEVTLMLSQPGANFQQDWDQIINQKIMERMNIPTVLYDRGGNIVSNINDADMSRTINLFETYQSDLEDFRRENRGTYGSITINRMKPNQRRQFTQEFIEWRQSKGRTPLESAMPNNQLWGRRDIDDYLRGLRLYNELSIDLDQGTQE